MDRPQGPQGVRSARDFGLPDLRAGPSRIAAMCEDYRAGATLDRAQDDADLAAGRHIAGPVLALWGDKGCLPPAPIRWPSGGLCAGRGGPRHLGGHFLPRRTPRRPSRRCSPSSAHDRDRARAAPHRTRPRRRRGEGPRPYRRAGSVRPGGHTAARHRRHVDRRDHRRGLCRGLLGEGDPHTRPVDLPRPGGCDGAALPRPGRIADRHLLRGDRRGGAGGRRGAAARILAAVDAERFAT